MADSSIIYTLTDEAPALATYSLLPIVQSYAALAGVKVETRDISLAGRIIAAFSDRLDADRQGSDALAELASIVLTPEANVIKLPNISASIPQLHEAITELQSQGFAIPDYPADPTTDGERDALARYKKVLGSAVNPVLRQGNSDRRAPASVKNYAKSHPHRMGAWSPNSKTNVAHMTEGDFFSTEVSAVMEAESHLSVTFVDDQGNATPLREDIPVK